MSGRDDITRWNRAGLKRIRYVDANAATYLEELRDRLASRFPIWEAIQRPDADGETAAQRNARLRAQYLASRGAVPDWGWEIARALARACHVLGEHVDAYANESYLATATQWESLRRLVALVDYHPSPPASAFTHLVAIAKPGASGLVPPGLAVAAAAPGVRVTFETMEALSITSALNVLRPEGFDRNPDVLAGDTLDLEGNVDGLAVGEPIVLEDEAGGSTSAHRIEGVVPGSQVTQVRITPALVPGVMRRGHTVVHVRPKDRLTPLAPSKDSAALGTEIALVRSSAGLAIGDVVTIADRTHRSYHRVTGVSESRITVDRPVGELRFESATLASTVAVTGLEARGGPANTFTVAVAGKWERLAQEVVADPRALDGGTLPLRYKVVSAVYTPVTGPAGADAGKTLLQLVPFPDGAIPSGGTAPPTLLVPSVNASNWTIDRPFVIGGREPITTTLPRSTAGGDFVVAVMGARLAWSTVASLVRDEPGARASLHPVADWQATQGEFLLATTTVFGHFTKRHRIDGWQINNTPVGGIDVHLELPEVGGKPVVPPELVPGRKLVVYRPDAPEQAFLTAVAAMAGDRLRLRDEIPASAGFTKRNLRIAGNVVLAGHGEHQPEKVLGSGDATLSGQQLLLSQREISFVPDPTQPRGVRADIDVIVDGRTWMQVGSLRDHGATAHVYTFRITEDGTLLLQFGDGQHGRRLPTGRNNVRVRPRIGVGLGGNVPAGRLTKITRPHPLVAAVEQPLPAVGGNDMEGADSMRRNAPATLFTMQRCISPEDFASLAATHASIWQARAFVRQSTGTRAHRVEVVVVPANGAALGELAHTLAAFLEQHALPNVDVTVTRFRPLPIRLSVEVAVDTSAFDPAVVVRDVRAALYDALSLRRRRLGQPVFLGDAYGVVENVRGVSTSHCMLNGDPGVHRILSVPDGVLFLDPDNPSTLHVSYEADR